MRYTRLVKSRVAGITVRLKIERHSENLRADLRLGIQLASMNGALETYRAYYKDLQVNGCLSYNLIISDLVR